MQGVWQTGAARPAHGPSEDAFDGAAEQPAQIARGPRMFGGAPLDEDEQLEPDRAVGMGRHGAAVPRGQVGPEDTRKARPRCTNSASAASCWTRRSPIKHINIGNFHV